MNIIIKVLKGEECNITVSPDTTILEVKQQIQKILKIPVIYQKIVIMGRSLIDENTISAYPTIKDGTKITLVVKKPDPLKDVMFRCFRKYYTEQQSEKLTTEFINDFEKRIKQLSLDDIEKIAIGLLGHQYQQLKDN